jgi:hypothetical protein
MSKTLFRWRAELGTAPDSAFNAQFGDVTYHVATQNYGYPAYVEVTASDSLGQPCSVE